MNTLVRDRAQSRFDELEEPPVPKLPAVIPDRVHVEQVRTARALPAVYPGKMCKAILAVTRGIGAIEKSGWNDFHKYHFQKWDDILDKLSPLLAEHGLIVTPSEIGRNLFENEQMIAITYEFTIVNEEGEVWPDRPVWTALARARDSKGVCDDKAANKCHTSAEKYFLIHFFKIRTSDSVDADADRPDRDPPPPASAKPHKLSTNCKFGQWKEQFLRFIGLSRSEQEVLDWERLNEFALDRISENSEAIYNEIAQGMRAKLATFRPADSEPETTEQETTGAADYDDEPPPPSSAMDPPMGRSNMSKAVEANKVSLVTTLIGEINALITLKGCTDWAARSVTRLNILGPNDRRTVDTVFAAKLKTLQGAHRND